MKDLNDDEVVDFVELTREKVTFNVVIIPWGNREMGECNIQGVISGYMETLNLQMIGYSL